MTITGQVVDVQKQTPIEFGNVILYSIPESTQVTGTVTDKDGRFRLEGIKLGSYYLEISFVGYETFRVENIECAQGARIDLGRLAIKQASIPVRGVEVIEEKPVISYQGEKKVIDVTKLTNVSSGTAVDALKNVPGVKVDIEGNVTLRGSANFTVLVDGKPSPLEANQVLKQIPATTIQRIEIITNPSAKYEPEGTAGIINIILKKQETRGLSALVNANAGLNNRYGGDVLTSYRRGIAKTYFGGNIGHFFSGYSSESETRTFNPEDTIVITSSRLGTWGSTAGSCQTGLELQIGPRDRTSISGRFGKYQGKSTSRSPVSERHLLGDSVREYQNEGYWRSGSDYFFFIADHEHHFDTTEHKLVGRAYVVGRNGSSRSGNRELDTAGITTNGRHNEEVGPTGWLRAELEYLLPTGEESKFEAGFQSRLERMKVNNRFYWFNTLTDTWDIDLGSSYPYLGTQEIHSLYATYSWNRQKITIQPGLRGEYGTRIIRILELDSIWQVNRWDYFPSLHLSYALFQNQRIKASYSRRIDRPYYWYLRPLLVWYDQKNVMKGNPLLLPSYVNSWEIGYELPLGANIFSLETYYRTTKDIFEWVTTKYSESTAVLLLTAANVGRIRSVGVDFSLNLTPVKWLTAFFTGDVADYHEWGALFSQEVDRHAITWSGSLNLTFQFLNTTQVQFTSNLSGPEITATGSSEGLFNADIAIKQTLFNRALSFTLRCSNLLGPGTWRSREQGLGFTSRFSYTGEGRTLSFAVSYNFNNFRLDPKMRVGEGIEQEGTGTIRQR